MPLPQQKTREIVFQLLYSYDLGKAQAEDMHPLLMKELAVSKAALRSAQQKVDLIFAKLSNLDQLIAQTSRSYAFERIQSVEKNILRLGAYELLYDKEIPPKVAIAEAMRLARKFSSPESAAFVNAVLDAIYKSNEGLKTDTKAIEQALIALIQSEEETKKTLEMQPEEDSE